MVPAPAAAYFDRIAEDYDGWKRLNPYYHAEVKRVVAEHVPSGAAVVEFGCGTGDVLASLAPRRGWGIDASPRMLEIARRKHGADPRLSFHLPDSLPLPLDPTPDAIVVVDVVEHLEDPEGAAAYLRRLAGPDTRLVFTMANPLWEPALLLLERAGWKMPEGPHRRLPFRRWRSILAGAGLRVVDRGRRCLVPHPAADALNRTIGRWPVVRALCLIEWFVAVPA